MAATLYCTVASELEASGTRTPSPKRPYGKLMVTAVERAVVQRWDASKSRAASTPGSRDERIRAVRSRFRKELVTLGAAAGGSAAVPGLGTMAAVSLTATEIAWTATRATDMILTVAAIHGHTDATAEERKAWTLAIFAFEEDAAASYTDLAKDLDKRGVGTRGPLPVGLLDKVNGRLGRYVIAKYGARRGALVMGKLLPFGIGAVIGGAANNSMVNTVIDRADTFFADLATIRPTTPPPPPRPALDPGDLPPPAPGTRALPPPDTVVPPVTGQPPQHPVPPPPQPERDHRDIIDLP